MMGPMSSEETSSLQSSEKGVLFVEAAPVGAFLLSEPSLRVCNQITGPRIMSSFLVHLPSRSWCYVFVIQLGSFVSVLISVLPRFLLTDWLTGNIHVVLQPELGEGGVPGGVPPAQMLRSQHPCKEPGSFGSNASFLNFISAQMSK